MLFSELICAQLCLTLLPQWTLESQVSLSVEFSRQGLTFPLQEDIPDSGIEQESPVSPSLAGRIFVSEPLGKLFSELMNMVFLGLGVSEIDDLWKYISLTLYQHLPYELVAIFIFFAH